MRYDIVFPDIEGCAPIGRLSYTAALQTRGIEVTYHEAIVAAQEKVTISFMRFPENTTWNGGEPYPDGVARVTIDGVETVYVPTAMCWEILRAIITDKVKDASDDALERLRTLSLKNTENAAISTVIDYAMQAALFYQKSRTLGSLILPKLLKLLIYILP